MATRRLTLQFPDKRTLRWIFQYEHDFEFMTKNLMPWAVPDGQRMDDAAAVVDFVITVYPIDPRQLLENETAELFFVLAGEVESRHPAIDNAISFISGPQAGDDLSRLRYCPTLCCWAPPLHDTHKTKICSTIENGNYPSRTEQVLRLQQMIPGLELFGKVGNRPLGGYHCAGGGLYGNDKYLGLVDYAFSVGIERAIADDYITEKFTDPIMCESIPIYSGAPNLHDYCVPEAYVSVEDVHTINWSKWESLYNSRLPFLLHQKELLRTRFNVFSYFDVLTRDLALLDQVRPITLFRPM